MRFFRILMLIGIIVSFSSCAVYSHKDICEPGSQEVCECEGGLTGGKTCWSNAMGWTECDCDCQPDCSGRECGPEPVCGYSCGVCPQGQTCRDGQCGGCTPDCKDRECGPDPVCGISCGSCAAGESCDQGRCSGCIPDCVNRECGPDPACFESCGVCQAGFDCRDGHCRPSNAGLGSPCPNGSDDCAPDFPVCLSGVGLSYCSNVCESDADCGGPPNCCDDLGAGLFCWDPSMCPGWSDIGEACAFNEVNSTAANCKNNLLCLGLFADGDSGFCPDGDVSECDGIPEIWNPDCVEGKCGASFCAEYCSANDSCPAGFIAQDVSGLCFCIPD